MNTQTTAMPAAEPLADQQKEPAADSALNAPRLVAATHESDVEAFLASGDGLYRKHRERLERLEASYQTERFRMVAAYERRMQAVVNEAKDSLRTLDRKHEKESADIGRMLSALAVLRDS